MIGWIQGRLVDKRPPALLIDVGGLGYELEAPMTTIYDLPEVGRDVALFTHLVVRDDAHQLFGFRSMRDRDVFRTMLKVSGVGAKLGLAILSGMDTDTFARCVHDADTASLSRLPGIGKKTAERLIIEMRDCLDGLGAGYTPPGAAAPASVVAPLDPSGEAVSALVALGLKPAEASRRVQQVAEKGLECEEIVRRALQGMVK